MTTPQLSVIVPTYQRRASVERLLRALIRQTLQGEAFEVIIAVDGSDDGTRETVEALSAPYALTSIWQPNSGRSRARNAGIRAARGEILLFFDDDMEPAPDCLEQHVQAHTIDVRAAVIGAVPVQREAADPPVAGYIAAKFQQHLDRLAQPDHRFTLRDFYSGHFSVRRHTLDEIGLFDESFQQYGNEDLELAWRLRAAGVKLIYRPEVVAYQHYSKDFAALAQDTLAQGQTAVLLADKHPDARAELRLNTFDEGSWRWRWARNGLLSLSRVVTLLPRISIAFVGWLEARHVKHLYLAYRFTLDYLYWLGADRAVRENRQPSQHLAIAGKSKA